MRVNGWYKRFSAYGDKLNEKVYPYQLRHTFALDFLRNGGNVFALQKIMGHSDMSMTKRYVALVEQDIQDQHSIASPVVKVIQDGKRFRRVGPKT